MAVGSVCLFGGRTYLILLHLVAEMDFVIVGFLCCIWAENFWQGHWLIVLTLKLYLHLQGTNYNNGP